MRDNRVELNERQMEEIIGGSLIKGNYYSTHVSDGGYLALRSDLAYDNSNIRGHLDNGSIVQFIGDSQNSDYVLVLVHHQEHGRWYDHNIEGEIGYVNKNYIQ